MSNIKRKQTNSPINNDKVPFATTVVTISVAVIALVAGYNWGYYQSNQNSIESINRQDQNELITYEDEDFRNISSYQGTVSEINGNIINITANVDENGEQSEKLMQVTTAENTTFRKIDISIPPIDPDELEEGVENPREKTVQLNDIQIGDTIIADASENIYGKSSFQAYQITVLATGF